MPASWVRRRGGAGFNYSYHLTVDKNQASSSSSRRGMSDAQTSGGVAALSLSAASSSASQPLHETRAFNVVSLLDPPAPPAPVLLTDLLLPDAEGCFGTLEGESGTRRQTELQLPHTRLMYSADVAEEWDSFLASEQAKSTVPTDAQQVAQSLLERHGGASLTDSALDVRGKRILWQAYRICQGSLPLWQRDALIRGEHGIQLHPRAAPQVLVVTEANAVAVTDEPEDKLVEAETSCTADVVELMEGKMTCKAEIVEAPPPPHPSSPRPVSKTVEVQKTVNA